MSAEHRDGMNGNDKDPMPDLPDDNPVRKRTPLRLIIGRDEDAEIANDLLQLVEKVNALDQDTFQLGADMIKGFGDADKRGATRFQNTDKLIVLRFELLEQKIGDHARALDAKIDKRFAALERRLFGPPGDSSKGEIAARAQSASGHALEGFKEEAERKAKELAAKVEDLAEAVEEATSPGDEGVITREQLLALREKDRLEQAFQESEKIRRQLEAEANERKDDKKDAARARRNALYGVAAALAVAAITALVGYLAGHSNGHAQGLSEQQRREPEMIEVEPPATPAAPALAPAASPPRR